MNEIKRYRTALNDNSEIRHKCECGYASAYADKSAFVETSTISFSGDLAWGFATRNFSFTCPKCNGGNPSLYIDRDDTGDTILLLKTESTEDYETEGRELAVKPDASLSERREAYFSAFEKDAKTTVEISCGCGNTDTQPLTALHLDPYGLAGNDFAIQCPDCNQTGGEESVLYKDDEGYYLKLRVGEFSGCPDCGEAIQEIGYKEGPEAPAIGWEYYECPQCNSFFNPNIFE